MLERIIFNILAFSLFVIMFFHMIRKNDTSYIVMLVLQAIGIAIEFIELLIGKYFGIGIRILTYTLSVILPITFIVLEKYNVGFIGKVYIFLAQCCMSLNRNKTAKELLLKAMDARNPKRRGT